MPYYKVLSASSDFTLIPTLFDNGIVMAQNEFRKVGKNYELVADFGFVNNYSHPHLAKLKTSIIFFKVKLQFRFKKFWIKWYVCINRRELITIII